jgi:hypothetical protein
MRWCLFLFLFLGCAHPFRETPPAVQRNTASTVVTRIELKLSEEEVFASGMDSSFLEVRLFDQQNQLIRSIDPEELNLETSEDIEVKPFIYKQGHFRSEILPRLKSEDISLRVDWRGEVFSPEVKLRTSIAPLRDSLEPVLENFPEMRSNGAVVVMRSWKGKQPRTEGFYFRNLGDNRIVKLQKSHKAFRSFNFEYLEQARQNLAFQVDDAPNSTVSHTMHSIFMVFPRKQLPTVEQFDETIEVTIPTGEKMIFAKESKEIVGGVFSEGPLDTSDDRFRRHYPDLKYRGRGLLLRVNARGQSPKLGQYETNRIDQEHGLHGSVDVLLINATTGQKCRRPKTDFWEPLDVRPVEFKFPTDEELDLYLRQNCGFGLPRF